jgi:SAM-dependent methyltransferase
MQQGYGTLCGIRDCLGAKIAAAMQPGSNLDDVRERGTMKSLRILNNKDTSSETNRLLSEFVNNYFRKSSNSNPVKILEAGCGRKWNLTLDVDRTLTGVDLSREAMQIRKELYDDIDNFIVGDLSVVTIDENTFDIVYCSYVLEHLRGVEEVLDRFFNWLRPEGITILIFPDRDTVFGFITRVTPHWFHIFYYKYILRNPNAGRPGYGPFPTYYDPMVSRRCIHEYCRNRGYEISIEFATPFGIQKSAGIAAPLISACVKLFAACSFGRLSGRHQNLVLVIRKP